MEPSQHEAPPISTGPFQTSPSASSSDPSLDPRFTPGRFYTPPRAFSHRRSPSVDPPSYIAELRQLQERLFQRLDGIEQSEQQLLQGQATILV